MKRFNVTLDREAADILFALAPSFEERSMFLSFLLESHVEEKASRDAWLQTMKEQRNTSPELDIPELSGEEYQQLPEGYKKLLKRVKEV
jgi:hypothetical protein